MLLSRDSVQDIVHRSGAALPVLSLGRLTCQCRVAPFEVAHYGRKLPQGYLADTDSSTHRPYRRLCAAARGDRFWAWVANLLGCLGILLFSFFFFFFFFYLVLTWLLIMRSSAQQTRQWALDQRISPRPHLSILRSLIVRVLQALFLVSRTSSLIFIIFVSLVSLALAIRLVPDVRDLETLGGVSTAVMAALGVISAWGVLHTSFTLHYAYLYYRSEDSAGGLAFPSEPSPTQLDFAYFAFTIAVSFAVSDVDVTDRIDTSSGPWTSNSLVLFQYFDPGLGDKSLHQPFKLVEGEFS